MHRHVYFPLTAIDILPRISKTLRSKKKTLKWFEVKFVQ